MSEPGDNCPECSRRLDGGPCPCGWSPGQKSDCKACDRERTDPERRFYCVTRCHSCKVHSPSTNAFHRDTPHTPDRGKRLCSGCWIPALERRAAGSTLDSVCPECGLTVREHIAEFKAAGRRIQARSVAL